MAFLVWYLRDSMIMLPAIATIWWAALPLAAVNAVVEELVFRGAMLRALAQSPGVVSVLVSSCSFGVAHWANGVPGGAVGAVAAGAFGAALAVLYRRTASLWWPVTVHIVVNCAILWTLG
ncbi:MAG: CPBP family intramembrane metalloprotease [Actinomycetia bacterium]|nr:CPBP family intramembrane metalloprotease [Actinomycetes bacterium]